MLNLFDMKQGYWVLPPTLTGESSAHCGSTKTSQKAMVIQQIFDDFNLTGSELLVVGDGSVEIENAKAVGAIAVGVTSAENNRYQMNADKRGRLLRAGADILIPDFRDGDRLLTLSFRRKSIADERARPIGAGPDLFPIFGILDEIETGKGSGVHLAPEGHHVYRIGLTQRVHKSP